MIVSRILPMQALRFLSQIAAAAALLTACLSLGSDPGVLRLTLSPELGHVLLDEGQSTLVPNKIVAVPSLRE